MLRAMVIVLLLALLPTHARADKRVALVIGNGAYVKVAALPNPRNDALAIADLLRRAGFDVVDIKSDLGVDAMRRALRDFSEQVRDADMALVFYAGHGMELNGVNYLIPVDATLARDVDAEDEAISLDRVIRTLEPARRLQLVILDSCRDNPFVRSMRRTIVSRSVRSGHADIDERALPPNTLIAYAQRAGATADDGTGSNSPYTTALLKHLAAPGLDIELALRRVRDEVLKATQNRQEPFKYGSLGGTELPLVPAFTTPALVVPAPQLGPSRAEHEWQQYAKDAKDIRLLEAFKEKHKADPFYVRLAEGRIEELKREEERKADAERQRLTNLARQQREVETAPKAPGSRCSQEYNIRSLEGTTSTSITFINDSTDTIRTYWIDYQGARKFYAEVPPGQSYDQQTYVTHPWVVTNRQEACIGVFMPKASPGRVVIGGR
jgi:uncharacterized caspase-like protein